MTDDKIALRSLLEKASDAEVLREMIGFAAERLMDLVWTPITPLWGAIFPAETHRSRQFSC
jgi:hypothetical protein